MASMMVLGKAPKAMMQAIKAAQRRRVGGERTILGWAAVASPKTGSPDHLQVVVDCDREIDHGDDGESEMAAGQDGREKAQLAHESDEGRETGEGEDADDKGQGQERERR